MVDIDNKISYILFITFLSNNNLHFLIIQSLIDFIIEKRVSQNVNLDL